MDDLQFVAIRPDGIEEMKNITITRDGYLANLPTTGPGSIIRSKVQAFVFGPDAIELGWTVRLQGEHWKG